MDRIKQILKENVKFDQITDLSNQALGKPIKRVGEQEAEGEPQIVDFNGKMCLVHKIKPSDTLLQVSLLYNVDQGEIWQVNNLANETIHHLKTLNIPMTEEFKMPDPPTTTASQASS